MATVHQHPFRLALVASLALHAALYVAVKPILDREVQTLPTAITPRLSFELRPRSQRAPAASPASTAADARPGQQPTTTPTRPRPDTAAGADRRAPTGSLSQNTDLNRVNPHPTPRSSRSLDLSLPPSVAPTSPDRMSETGSTVFDPDLAARILKERSARSAVPAVGSDVRRGRAMGGRWEEFVEIDGLCFRVIERDPLNPLSTDQWFPVSCD